MRLSTSFRALKGGSDTYNNLCLVNRSDNLNKGDVLFATTLPKPKRRRDSGNSEKCLERLPAKAWRFEPGARGKSFEETGDIDETKTVIRTDTRYVAKMALRYLRVIIDREDSDEVAKTAHFGG